MTRSSDPATVARAVLSERRFHNPPIPRPLHGVLDWITARVDTVVDALRNVLADLGGAAAWVVVAVILAVALVSAVLARHVLRRRVLQGAAPVRARGPGGPSARDLERAAERAEREGRPAEAVRLRYRAGLLALAERGLIGPQPSLRAHELRARLRSPLFEELTRAFERVAYGGGEADAATVSRAREGWRELLAERAR